MKLYDLATIAAICFITFQTADLGGAGVIVGAVENDVAPQDNVSRYEAGEDAAVPPPPPVPTPAPDIIPAQAPPVITIEAEETRIATQTAKLTMVGGVPVLHGADGIPELQRAFLVLVKTDYGTPDVKIRKIDGTPVDAHNDGEHFILTDNGRYVIEVVVVDFDSKQFVRETQLVVIEDEGPTPAAEPAKATP